jgi:signal transduction histidine kinase
MPLPAVHAHRMSNDAAIKVSARGGRYVTVPRHVDQRTGLAQVLGVNLHLSITRTLHLEPFRSLLHSVLDAARGDSASGHAADSSPLMGETSHPIVIERSRWWRTGVVALIVGIFWIDVSAPQGVVVPMFYVLPTLLFMWGGRWWEPSIVAAVATGLTVAGLHIHSADTIPAVAMVNRSLEIAGIWLASVVVMLHRVLVLRSLGQAAAERAERQSAERRLRGQAALAQLGKLTAVVAHEVRNPLAGVRASLQVLKSRFRADAQEPRVIDAMIERLDALNAKVTDILIYSHPAAPKVRDVHLRPLVADAVASARAATGTTAAPIAISGDDPLARADPEMLRPALLNLLINACQAAGTGDVEVVLASGHRTSTVAIMDRGPGIPPELRERVFEPFFTTKPTGTGLGLPVVSRLVELQDGRLFLHDRAGGGTIAEITLPAA